MRWPITLKLGQAAAIAILAVAALAAVITFARESDGAGLAAPKAEPEITALDRCRMESDAGGDPVCREAWRVIREHFSEHDHGEMRP